MVSWIARLRYFTTSGMSAFHSFFAQPLQSSRARMLPLPLCLQTQKWRERISTEMEFAERFAKFQEANMTAEERDERTKICAPPERRWSHGPTYLFDLGKEATGGVTPYEMKDSRDTWYSKHRVKELDDGKTYTGGVLLSSHAYGDNLKDYHEWTKPEFARQPIIRDNFFRSTGRSFRNPYRLLLGSTLFLSYRFTCLQVSCASPPLFEARW